MQKNRNSLLSGVFWTYAERIAAQGVSTVVTIILARILMPEDYGVVAIATIVLNFCDIFVTDSFGNALVQKKDSDELDFSTVFFCNLLLSIFLYLVVFSCAPLIAEYYASPELTAILRVLCLRIPISSINSLQHAYVSKQMQFRKFFFSTLFGTIVSAFVGIYMAYAGYGAWALVTQYMTNTIIDTIVLFITVQWRPRWMFSLNRLKPLFSYGWKLLFSALISKGFSEVRDLIIGKKYSTADLAYFNKGKQFPALIVNSYNTAIGKVLFAAVANEQDDKAVVKGTVKRTIRMNIFVLSPLLMGLAMIAEPFVKLLLTDKWLFCVDYLRVFCIIYLLEPIQTINMNSIRAVGRSDVSLRIEIVKKSLDLVGMVIALCVFKSVMAIVIAQLITTSINTVFQIIPCKKLINYGMKEQLLDYLPSLVDGLIMCVGVWLVGKLNIDTIAQMVLQIICGGTIYVLIAIMFKFPQVEYALNYIKRKKKVNGGI